MHRSSPAALLCLLLLAAGCVTPPPYRIPKNYPVRFSDIQTITLVPPLVSVYAMSSGNVEQEIQEWSDAANEHAQGAVRDVVTGMDKAFVPYAGRRGPVPDFRLGVDDVNRRAEGGPGEQSWLLFESAVSAILRHTYDLAQIFPRQMEHFDYTLGTEARALLAGTEADAFLLMIATDYVPTVDRAALIGVGAAASLVTGSYAGPGATPAELTVALVDSRSGDILFFNRTSMPLVDLRDPDANKALVAGVLKGMAQ
jgi:hypothetical protein